MCVFFFLIFLTQLSDVACVIFRLVSAIELPFSSPLSGSSVPPVPVTPPPHTAHVDASLPAGTVQVYS